MRGTHAALLVAFATKKPFTYVIFYSSPLDGSVNNQCKQFGKKVEVHRKLAYSKEAIMLSSKLR